MRAFSRVPIALLLLCLFASSALISSAHAQTYTPKAIRIDAPATVDTAEALGIAALKSGTPLTKEQIEAALQRIADTGLFSGISYTVNSDALIIKLTPSASSQLQPVRFANFVWWQPAELETLLEASVPAYHGHLPLAGTLTDRAEAALVSLLHTKSIDATVTSMQATDVPGGPITAISLIITRPSITIDQVNLQNALPSLEPQLKTLEHRLHGEDFDTGETTRSLQDSTNDIYQNAGYLDVSTSAPSYSSPRKDLDGYAVDLTANIQPGEIYHVSRFTIQAAPPVSQAELKKAAAIKPGDHASVAAERLAQGEMQKVYRDQGYLDAKVAIDPSKDSAAHTIAYTASILPGEIYHLASVDTSTLSPEQQAAFAHAFHVAPGAIANADLTTTILHAFMTLHAPTQPRLAFTLDTAHHTVIIAINPASASTPPPQ